MASFRTTSRGLLAGSASILLLVGCSYTTRAPERAAVDPSPDIADVVETEPTTDEPASATVLGTTEAAADDEATEQAVSSASAVVAATENFAIVGVPRGLNLRSGPGVGYGVIVGVEKDRIVTSTGRTDNGWVEVRIDDQTGWMAADYLRPTDASDPGSATEAASAPAETSESDDEATGDTGVSQVLVVVDVPAGINVRSGPGVEYAVVTGAPLGATVVATGRFTDRWVEVDYDGVTGWALGSRLRATS